MFEFFIELTCTVRIHTGNIQLSNQDLDS